LREFLQRIGLVDSGQARDWPPPAGYHDLGTLLHALQMLAKAIMKLSHTDLVVQRM